MSHRLTESLCVQRTLCELCAHVGQLARQHLLLS